MTDKQKKNGKAILLSLVLFLLLVIITHTGILPFNPDTNESIVAEILLFLVLYLWVARKVLLKAVRNISKGHVFDENFLMGIASIGAFVIGEYTEAVAVMLFYQIGEWFEDYAVNRSRASIAELMDICPEYANLKNGDSIEVVDPDDVSVGDVIVVKPGERIPLDGIVRKGESLVDTSALTGESVPRAVAEGNEIISGCVNGSGTLEIEVTKEFEDSTVVKILELVENASSKKANVENFITRFARYYTPIVVISAALLAMLSPLIGDISWMDSLKRACIFLVISCPCALVISVPLGFFGGIGAASSKGILVKGSNYLEALSGLDTIVFDKTGTLTKGEFVVAEIVPADLNPSVDREKHDDSEESCAQNEAFSKELLKLAASIERYSNHPIAASLLNAWGDIELFNVENVEEISGSGVKGLLDGKELLAGNQRLMDAASIIVPPVEDAGTVVYVALDSECKGYIIIKDEIKPDSAKAIANLRKLGVRQLIMLTGDKKAVGDAVGAELGLDKVYSELLPQDKVCIAEELLETMPSGKKLAFVGDGINDAPVLARCDIGIAMGSMGSDAAIEAADIVLMDDQPHKIATVMKIATKTRSIVTQNIIFALGVKLLVMILGAIGMANMWGAVFADVGVSALAILNSMRALRVKE